MHDHNEDYYYEDEHRDDLSAARGIKNGCLIAAVLWCGLIFLTSWLLSWLT